MCVCVCSKYICVHVCVRLCIDSATEEHEKVQRESLISAVTDRIKHQVRNALDQGEVEMSQLIVTQEKLKKGSEELNRKLQNMEDEQVRGGISHVTVTWQSLIPVRNPLLLQQCVVCTVVCVIV